MDYKGLTVVSTAGHDKGSLLCVVECDGEYVFVADGKRRKVQSLKKKKVKHIALTNIAAYSGPMTNKAIKAHLRVCREELECQRGTT